MEETGIVDVDGSYLYRKYRSLVDAGQQVSLPACPPLQFSGWKVVTDDTYQTIAPSIPAVTSGLTIILFIEIVNMYYSLQPVLFQRFGVCLLGWSYWTHW